MLLDLSKSLNYLYYFIIMIMSTNFAFFLLEQTDNMSAPVSTTSNRKSAKFLDIIAHDKVYRIV